MQRWNEIQIDQSLSDRLILVGKFSDSDNYYGIYDVEGIGQVILNGGHTFHSLGKFCKIAPDNVSNLELLFLEDYEVITPLGERLISYRNYFLSDAIRIDYINEILFNLSDISSFENRVLNNRLKKKVIESIVRAKKLLMFGQIEMFESEELKLIISEAINKTIEMPRETALSLVKDWHLESLSDPADLNFVAYCSLEVKRIREMRSSVLPNRPNEAAINQFLVEVYDETSFIN